MGFLGSILDKSLFTKESARGALYGRGGTITNPTGGYAVLKITPRPNEFTNRKDVTVIGLIQEPISFNIEANWSELGGAAALTNIPFLAGMGLGELADAVTQGVNAPLKNAGLTWNQSMSTKLIYQSSGYLTISPKIRVVDWNGTGQPILAAVALTSYCVPQATDIGKDQIEAMATGTANLLGKVGETLDNATEKATGPVKQTLEVAKSVSNVIEKGSKETLRGADDAKTLRASPNDCVVEIGEFFYHEEMVVTSVNLSFSKEVTNKGPLYLDATISLSSRFKINDLSRAGFKAIREPRVIINNFVEEIA